MDVQLQEANPDAKPAEAATPGTETPSEAPAASSTQAPLESSPERPGGFRRIRHLFTELFESLFSFDPATRRVALLFYLSVFGVIAVSIIGIERMSHLRAQRAAEEKEMRAEQKRVDDLQKNRLDDLKFQEGVLDLGRFVITLKRFNGSRDIPTADFELFVRCNEKEVREYIEARNVKVRSELTSALVGMTREDFLATDGKRRTHKKILAILNQWLAREYSGARIEDIWFSDLVVE